MSCLGVLFNWLRLSKSYPRQEQQGKSLLLILPPEILFEIFEHLPFYSQHILAQTCSALQNTLREPIETSRNALQEDRKEYQDFTTLVEWNIPTRLMCEHCAKPHRLHINDTPTQWNDCYSMHQCPPLEQLMAPSLYQWVPFNLNMRHVQLALKFHRLDGGKHGAYVRSLLLPARGSEERLFQNVPAPYVKIRPHVVHYQVTPAVVGARYLLRIQYDWDHEDGPPSIIEMCHHLKISKEAWTISSGKGEPRMLRELNAADEVVNRAMSFPGRGRPEILGHCKDCVTSFSVQGTAVTCKICIWQDLGPETRQTYAPKDHGQFGAVLRVETPPEFDSVRELYESA